MNDYKHILISSFKLRFPVSFLSSFLFFCVVLLLLFVFFPLHFYLNSFLSIFRLLILSCCFHTRNCYRLTSYCRTIYHIYHCHYKHRACKQQHFSLVLWLFYDWTLIFHCAHVSLASIFFLPNFSFFRF